MTVRREWEPEELIGAWTLVEADRQLLANKTGASRRRPQYARGLTDCDGRFLLRRQRRKTTP